MKRGDICRIGDPLAPISSANIRTVLSLRTDMRPVATFRAAIANTGFERMAALLHNDPTAWAQDERTITATVSAVVQIALAEAEQERITSGEITPFNV